MLKNKLLTLISVLILSVSFINVVSAGTANALFDNAKGEACGGVNLSDKSATCTDSSGKLSGLMTTALNILSIIIGIIAVVMIIIGGLKFITSSGDSGNTASARNTILYAIIGLVIVALAQIIVRYVLKQVT